MVWVCFDRSESWLSKAIRRLTRGSYSHAYIVWREEHLGWVRMEAAWNGFRIRLAPTSPADMRPVKTYDAVSRPATEIAVPLEDRYHGLVRHAAQWLDTPYDYPALLGFLWNLLGRLFGRSWRNPLSSPNALFCSEAIAQGLKDLGHPAFAARDPATVSPADLLDLVTTGRSIVWVRRG